MLIRYFLLMVFVVAATAAQADNKIVLKSGNTQSDSEFIFNYFAIINSPYEISNKDIFVGRHDLNDDGEEELFVLIYHFAYCGTVGCNTIIFQKVNGVWKSLAEFSVYAPGKTSWGEVYLYAKQEGQEYKTIYGKPENLRWDRGDYRGF